MHKTVQRIPHLLERVELPLGDSDNIMGIGDLSSLTNPLTNVLDSQILVSMVWFQTLVYQILQNQIVILMFLKWAQELILLEVFDLIASGSPVVNVVIKLLVLQLVMVEVVIKNHQHLHSLMVVIMVMEVMLWLMA